MSELNFYVAEKKYGRKTILKDIKLSFPKGTSTVIIGSSGGGKSTLVQSITGLTLFNGQITDTDGNKFDRNQICYIPQHPQLNRKETVFDSLMYQALYCFPDRNINELKAYVNQIIVRFSLGKVRDQRISTLSGGQEKRVWIAKGLIRDLPIIIADEIDSGLDVVLGEAIINELCKAVSPKNAEPKTLIIISHNIYNLELYDRVVILAAGRLAYEGPVQNVKRHFRVSDYPSILKLLNSKEDGGYGLSEKYIQLASEGR